MSKVSFGTLVSKVTFGTLVKGLSRWSLRLLEFLWGPHFQYICGLPVYHFSGTAFLLGRFSRIFLILLFILWTAVFLGTALTGYSNILRTFFILVLHGGKVFWKALFVHRFLMIIWYWISYLLNINSALVIQKGLLHRWLIYWRNVFIDLQFLITLFFSRWFFGSVILTFSLVFVSLFN